MRRVELSVRSAVLEFLITKFSSLPVLQTCKFMNVYQNWPIRALFQNLLILSNHVISVFHHMTVYKDLLHLFFKVIGFTTDVVFFLKAD